MRILLALLLALAPAAEGVDALGSARARVDHHVHRADALVAHFDDVLRDECPRFADHAQWQSYLDGEIDRLVLLMAHIEEAWAEAKQTGDDDVRRAAKEPRRGLEQAQSLGDKLQTCAEDNGSTLSTAALFTRIQRELPNRRAEIALPR